MNEQYQLDPAQVANMIENRLFEFRSIIAQSEIDAAIYTAQGKADEATAAQAKIDEAKAAIDALLALG